MLQAVVFLWNVFTKKMQETLGTSNGNKICWIWTFYVMINYWTYKHFIGKKIFFVLAQVWDKEKFWVPMRNWTSVLQIPCSEALPLSHRNSMVSKVLTKFIHNTSCILLESAMSIASYFVYSIRKIVSFKLGKK